MSMSLRRLFISLLLACIPAVMEAKVFLNPQRASGVLRSRQRRANYFLEEVKPGNLERECNEETCSLEEAFEIFHTKEKTMEFWYKYQDTNHCDFNPCLNGGICSVNRNDYGCLCPPRYEGKNCETEVFECEYKNGGCLHYCNNLDRTSAVSCTCADGYELEEDGQSCREKEKFPCGKQWRGVSWHRSMTFNDTKPLNTFTLNSTSKDPGNPTLPWVNSTLTWANSTHGEWPNATLTRANSKNEDDRSKLQIHNEDLRELEINETRIVGGQLQRQGGSPWQVLLRRKDGYGFCGGTLINDRWVITAAHCLQDSPDHVTIGDYDKKRPDPDEQKIAVAHTITHPFFHEYTFDSDIALLYLNDSVVFGPYAVPACLPNPNLSKLLMRDGTMGLATGWGATRYLGRSSRFLRKVALPVVDHMKCIGSTQQIITDNMFCAGYLEMERDACSGDSGGPYVVNYRGTWFLTGVVSWGERCAAQGKYGVYTRLGNYLSWIRDTIRDHERIAATR